MTSYLNLKNSEYFFPIFKRSILFVLQQLILLIKKIDSTVLYIFFAYKKSHRNF